MCAGPEEGIVTMALGSTIPASLYTLLRLWDQLKAEAEYAKRLAQVNDFNKSSMWLKRGISITPCRCACPGCPSCQHCCQCKSQVAFEMLRGVLFLRREWLAHLQMSATDANRLSCQSKTDSAMGSANDAFCLLKANHRFFCNA